MNTIVKFLSDMATSSNVPNFEIGKIFLKPVDQPEMDWQEMVGEVVSDSITIREDVPDMKFPTRLNFTATLNISRNNFIRILKSIGLMKRPRCTYKTIRRYCAKRNK